MLSEHLKEACDAYSELCVEDQAVMPISKIDAENIDLLIEILSKTGAKQLADVLREWKDKDDQEIYDKLLTLSNSIKKQVFLPRNILEVGKVFKIDVKFLNTIKVSDGYDYDKNHPVYNIIVNEDGQDKTLYCNQIVSFRNPEERNSEVERMKDVLKDCNVHFI